MKNKEIGNLGEEIATRYLIKSGYVILQRNYTSRFGEIDIIAKDIKSKEIVFVEVKSRTNNLYGKPIDAINIKKLNHICKTARQYIFLNHLEKENIRIDAIEIYINKKIKLNHIKAII